MTIYENSCANCKWYLTSQSCLAFPDKIPDEIWEGKNKHKRVFANDHGYKFKPIEELEAINENPTN